MTQSEFELWIEFYLLQPFDDLHRYHRPAALIAKSIGGGEIGGLIEWLQPEPKPTSDEYSDADLATFAALGVKPPK